MFFWGFIVEVCVYEVDDFVVVEDYLLLGCLRVDDCGCDFV